MVAVRKAVLQPTAVITMVDSGTIYVAVDDENACDLFRNKIYTDWSCLGNKACYNFSIGYIVNLCNGKYSCFIAKMIKLRQAAWTVICATGSALTKP